MSRVQRCRQGEADQLGADAHHLTSQIRLRRLLSDAASQQRVADECMIGHQEANAARSVARRVYNGELELPKLEFVTVQQVTVGRAEELLRVG